MKMSVKETENHLDIPSPADKGVSQMVRTGFQAVPLVILSPEILQTLMLPPQSGQKKNEGLTGDPQCGHSRRPISWSVVG